MKLFKKITLFSMALAAISALAFFAIPSQQVEAKPPFNVYTGTVTNVSGNCVTISKCNGGSLTFDKGSASVSTGNTYEFFMEYGGSCGAERIVSAYRSNCGGGF